MVNFLIVSNVLLWACVISLVMVIFALLRQVGVLYERVAPAGALMMNRKLQVGNEAPQMALADLQNGSQVQVGGLRPGGRSQLLFFLDAKCPVCKTLLPALKSAQQAERSWLDIVLVGDDEEAAQRAFIEQYSLQGISFLNSELLGKSYAVSKLPYAVLINNEGKITSLGLVNSREHLESLFEAQERGVASIQDFLEQGRQPEVGIAMGIKS